MIAYTLFFAARNICPIGNHLHIELTLGCLAC